MAQFRRFCKATGHTFPEQPPWSDITHPVVGVSWEDAQAYCEWAGLTLPTEAQWEYAARSSDGRFFPWGPSKQGERMNFSGFGDLGGWRRARQQERRSRRGRDGYDQTAPCGTYPDGAGPFGHLDLAGNVSEWCLDKKCAYTDPTREVDGLREAEDALSDRMVRGGSFLAHAILCRATRRSWCWPGQKDDTIGFRVAKSRRP